MAKKMPSGKRKESTVLPIVIGCGLVAALVVVIFVIANIPNEPSEKSVATEAAADDGELENYEDTGAIELADYSSFEITREEDDDDASLKDSVWEDYLESCTVNDYPEELYEEAYSDTYTQYENFAAVSGMTLEELFESYGMDEGSISEVAYQTVEGRLVAKTIAVKEGITLTDDELREYLIALMDYEGDSAKESLDELYTDYIEGYGSRPKDDCYVEKIKDFFFDRTNVKEE